MPSLDRGRLRRERIWLVLDEPGTGFTTVDNLEHQVSTAMSLAREIAPGDRVLFVRPEREKIDGTSLPATVVRVAQVAEVRPTNSSERRLLLDPDSVVSLLPGIPLGNITPPLGEISVDRPIAEIPIP